jgi:hypothetical protein
MDEQQNQQPDEQPAAGTPPQRVGTSRGAIIFVIVLLAIAIIFSLFFSGVFGLYGGPGGLSPHKSSQRLIN